MNKIKLVSRLLRIFFQLNFFVVPFLLVLYWMGAPESLHILPGFIEINLDHSMTDRFFSNCHSLNGFPVVHTLSTTAKIFGFVFSLVPAGFYLFGCYFAVKLFRSYENNEIFSFNNVKYIRNISYILFWSQLIGEPVYQALISVTITWNNHPKFLSIDFDQTNFGILFISLLMILVSWIMTEGYKLREEQKFTV